MEAVFSDFHVGDVVVGVVGGCRGHRFGCWDGVVDVEGGGVGVRLPEYTEIKKTL